MADHSFNKGFTLIELLVVVSIIGMLASMVLVSLNAARNRAIESAVIQEAVQMIRLMQGSVAGTGDYSPYASAGWVGYFGNANCDTRPSFLSSSDQDSLVAICHKLFSYDYFLSVGSGGTTQPILISMQQRYSNYPWQDTYKWGYGLTMYLKSNKIVCVGTEGIADGVGDINAPNTSCYYAPPIINN